MWGHGVLPTALPAPFSTTLSPALLVYLRECGAAESASGQTACPIRPTLCQSQSSPPPLPISAPPTSLDECLFFISLVSDFLAVGFSVNSGCARRRSVSTYAAILVLLRRHKELLKLNSKKTNNPVKNELKTLIDIAPQKIYRWQVTI